MGDARQPIALDDEGTWPRELLERLERDVEMLRAWDKAEYKRMTSDDVAWRNSPGANPHDGAYDTLVSDCKSLLDGGAFIGYHCARLHEDEIADVLARGMPPLSPALLQRKLQARIAAGELPQDIGDRMLSEQRGGDSCRAGRLYFVFNAEPLTQEPGVGRFFRYWGGEGLYGLYDHAEPEVAAHLEHIGVPCIVEASIEIDALPWFTETEKWVVESFQRHRKIGVQNDGVEAALRDVLRPSHIRQIHRLGEPRFMELTSCHHWDVPPR